MNLIRGRDGEWLTDATCNRVHAGSIPTPASNFAARAEASTSAPAFNHTAEAMRPKQPKVYASAVSFPRKVRTQWTNNKNENNAAW
jgi:hypothetical protein